MRADLQRPNAEFWKRKLIAFLHDPPCKALDVGPVHEAISESFIRQALAGEDAEWIRRMQRTVRDADHWASAADRFTFPKRKCAAAFTGRTGATFRHPLGKAEFDIDTLPERTLAEEILTDAFGGIQHADDELDETERWRQVFFLYWRRWLEQTILHSDHGMHARNLAYYPADTRIPDHTIWNHMSLTSAFEACRVDGIIQPAFVVFQLGPVQDFIAAARSTRDLWSGSYMLAWLTAHAIKAVTDQLGPDNIIFPALRGQGIFDVLHRDELYSRIAYKSADRYSQPTESLWQRMAAGMTAQQTHHLERWLLTPCLPNRFVALAPAPLTETLGRAAERAIADELGRISESCWHAFSALCSSVSGGLHADMKRRWDAQVAAFPSIAWAAVPWETDIDEALSDFHKLPVNRTEDDWSPAVLADAYRRLAVEILPVADQDSRFYDGTGGERRLNNPGFLWSVNYQRAEFALAARRNTRDFDQFLTDDNQAGAPKDALTGKEEIVGSEALWRELLPQAENTPFKDKEGPYGALSIIKRLWCRSETGYLLEKLGISRTAFQEALSLDSVASVASANDAGQRPGKTDDEGDPEPKNGYVAVIAMDGDNMGMRVSGQCAPPFLEQLAERAAEYFRSLEGTLEDLPRLLTPSYHMQFSEALSNVAIYVADRVVRCHAGQLIYAGGDDVLAMVPADKALDCAQALRAAFRGDPDGFPAEQREYNFAVTRPGFILVDKEYPAIVPGPATDVSCGIAVAHYKHPLQAIVREAQAAERRAKADRAKGGYERGAFAVTLIKRGGETIHWGAKWDDRNDDGGARCPALNLLRVYARMRAGDKLSNRFPYALAALLAPYELERTEALDADFNTRALLEAELAHATGQQGSWTADDPDRVCFLEACRIYLDQVAEQRPGDFMKLFLTAAFLDRPRHHSEGSDR